MANDYPSLKRPIRIMPEFARRALEKSGLMEKYIERPPYQRNDYIMWISGAKRDKTKEKRLNQMLNELKQGSVYMKMPWKNKQGL